MYRTTFQDVLEVKKWMFLQNTLYVLMIVSVMYVGLLTGTENQSVVTLSPKESEWEVIFSMLTLGYPCDGLDEIMSYDLGQWHFTGIQH